MRTHVLAFVIAHREFLAAAAVALAVRVAYVFPGVKRWYRESRVGRVLSVIMLVATDIGPDFARPFQRVLEARRHARLRRGMRVDNPPPAGQSGR